MKKWVQVCGERNWNFVAILALCSVLGFVFCVEFFLNQEPCSLCFLQRLALMGVSFSLYLNILWGIKLKHYSLALFWSLLGLAVAVRHILLKVCESKLSNPFTLFSFRLASWSFALFFLSIIGIAGLICLPKKNKQIQQEKDALFYIAFSLLFLTFSLGLFSVVWEIGWKIH